MQPKTIETTKTTAKVSPAVRAELKAAIAFAKKIETGIDDAGPINPELLVTITCRGVTVSVMSNSNLELIIRDWSRAKTGCIGKRIGPHPKPVLSDTELERDAQIQNERAEKRKLNRIRRRQKEAALHRPAQHKPS